MGSSTSQPSGYVSIPESESTVANSHYLKCCWTTTKDKPCKKDALPGKQYCSVHIYADVNTNHNKCDWVTVHDAPCRNLALSGKHYCSAHSYAEGKFTHNDIPDLTRCRKCKHLFRRNDADTDTVGHDVCDKCVT
jgi:hypothetical protein